MFKEVEIICQKKRRLKSIGTINKSKVNLTLGIVDDKIDTYLKVG